MVYRTMQGKVIDLEKLMRENETLPAVGNMRVNARGDEIGQGGKIVRTREQIVAEYYKDNPKGNKIKQERRKEVEQAAPDILVEQPKQTKTKQNKLFNDEE